MATIWDEISKSLFPVSMFLSVTGLLLIFNNDVHVFGMYQFVSNMVSSIQHGMSLPCLSNDEL